MKITLFDRTITGALLIRRFKEALPMVLYFVTYFTWFYVLEHVDRLHYTVIHTDIDDRIPFVEAFIIPYDMWFLYVALVILFLFFTDMNEYRRCAAALCIGMTVFLVVSTLWPNIQHLRPAVMPRDNFCTDLVLKLYKTDTPTNICPSIHVYNTLCVMTGTLKCSARFIRRNAVRAANIVLSILIILSTMFLKQHSFFDVVCALALFAGIFVLVYHFGFTFSGSRVVARTARVPR